MPGFRLITQNVDGLHERAGTRQVIRFHGSLWDVACRDGCATGKAARRHDGPLPELPPRCPGCGGFLRPGVVWFGEPIDPRVLAAASEAALGCDLALAIGTSAVVYPAAGLLSAARGRGAFTAEVNPEATPATGAVSLTVSGRAEEVLDAVERLLLSG
jgi:NAD-dependent deacetylase